MKRTAPKVAVTLFFNPNAPMGNFVLMSQLAGLEDLKMDAGVFATPQQKQQQQIDSGQEELPLLPGPKRKKFSAGPGEENGILFTTRLLVEAGKMIKGKDVALLTAAAGRAAGSSSSNLTNAQRKGYVKNTEGYWSPTAAGRKAVRDFKKQQAKTADAAPASAEVKTGEKKYGGGAQLILDTLKAANGPLTFQNLREAFKKDGRSPYSVPDQVRKLALAGQLKKTTSPENGNIPLISLA